MVPPIEPFAKTTSFEIPLFLGHIPVRKIKIIHGLLGGSSLSKWLITLVIVVVP